jgi:hypothetical protein
MPISNTAELASVAAWDHVLRIDQTMSRTAARALLDLQFTASDVDRMQILAAKARKGKLSASESLEIDTIERLGCLLDILHSKARRTLKRRKVQAG